MKAHNSNLTFSPRALFRISLTEIRGGSAGPFVKGRAQAREAQMRPAIDQAARLCEPCLPPARALIRAFSARTWMQVPRGRDSWPPPRPLGVAAELYQCQVFVEAE